MISAVILAGGIASRMGDLCATTPKPMLRFDREPFLAYLASWLMRMGCSEIVIVSGHLSEKIEAYFCTRRWQQRGVRVVNDGPPRGTAFSALAGISEARHGIVFQCNGDTLVRFDFDRMQRAFKAQKRPAMTLLTRQRGVQNQGAVLTSGDRVIDIKEGYADKEPHVHGTLVRASSTGSYFLNRDFALENMPGKGSSFERDVLPLWVGDGHLSAADIGLDGTRMVDFGTPERYYDLQRHVYMVAGTYGTPLEW